MLNVTGIREYLRMSFYLGSCNWQKDRKHAYTDNNLTDKNNSLGLNKKSRNNKNKIVWPMKYMDGAHYAVLDLLILHGPWLRL